MSDDLSSEIETADFLETDRNLRLRPFALLDVSELLSAERIQSADPSELITLNLFLVSASETSLVD